LRRLDDETSFMRYEPGERTTTLRQQAERLRSTLASINGTFLLAEGDSLSVGFLEAIGGSFRRNRHVTHLVVGVLQAYAGRGVGTALMLEAGRWAKGHGLHRLELTVVVGNAAAVALYEKAGFAVEGTRRHSLLVHGSHRVEYYMVKLLT